jgi:hypothetical protein
MSKKRNGSSSRRRKTRQVPATCPPQFEGDALLEWVRKNEPQRAPSDAQLAAVKLIGADYIATVPFHQHGLDDAHLFTASVEDVRAYFAEHDPDAVFTDEGARLNALCRRRAERHGFTTARWAMWGIHHARSLADVRRVIGPSRDDQLRAVVNASS